MSNACTYAARAAWASVGAGATGKRRRRLQRRAERRRVAASARVRRQVAAVERRHDAADHGDAERAAELAGGVVDRRADAGLVQRQRDDDRARRRRGGHAHAGRGDDQREREHRVVRRAGR